jgi:hypothetical protein
VDALWAAEKTGAEDYVSAAIENGFEEFGVVARIVFEVGVLDEDDVSGNLGEATAERCALSLIVSLEKDAKIAEIDGISAVKRGSGGFAGILQLQHFLKNLAGAVGGAVVYQDDFFAGFGFDHAAKDFVDGGAFVVNGNDDGELGIDEGERVVAWMGHRGWRRKCNGGVELE